MGFLFFVFQKISYLADVYLKKVEQAQSLINYSLYVLLFPQLIAGPIVKYHLVEQQIKSRIHSSEKFLNNEFKFKNRLFPPLVRIESQLNYYFFKQIKASYSSSILVGKNGHLFERTYLSSVNNLQKAKIKKTEKFINKIERIKKKLLKHNLNLNILITPNKLSVYPEIVPDNYLIPRDKVQPSLYETFIQLSATYDFGIIDLNQKIIDLKNKINHPLFAPSGTHMSEYACCIAASEIIKKINKPKYSMPKLDCRLGKIKKTPFHMDRDLTQVANLIYPEQIYLKVPRTLSRIKDNFVYKQKPKVLFIGTSYMWGILRYFDKHSYFKIRDFIYYFKTLHKKSGKVVKDFKCDKKKFKEYLMNFDEVIIEVNETSLDSLGQGFLKCVNSSL